MEIASQDEFFLPTNKILAAFRQYPSIITNTYRIIDPCNIEMDFDTDKTKIFFGPSKSDDLNLLRKLAKEGLRDRYGDNNNEATERLKKELKIIEDLGFVAYFLRT